MEQVIRNQEEVCEMLQLDVCGLQYPAHTKRFYPAIGIAWKFRQVSARLQYLFRKAGWGIQKENELILDW